MGKTLIVYFSHSGENYFAGSIRHIQKGNTQVLCEKLARLTGADLFEIQPLHEYPENYSQCTSLAKTELNQDARPKIANMVHNMEDYSTIYLAYPNWWGTYPRVIATFIESYPLSGKDIYPICTHEGSGMGNSVKDLKKALKSSTVHEGFAMQGSKVNTCDEQLKKYVEGK